VNDTGLAAVLLNRSLDVTSSRRRRFACSRGVIVPQTLSLASIADALDFVTGIESSRFDLFRLVLAQETTLALLTSDGRSVSFSQSQLVEPAMVTSSSLGDTVVEGPRRRLFTRLLSSASPWTTAQRRYHFHQWSRHPELSVLMQRADARTVSHTVVDVSAERVSLRYRPLGVSCSLSSR
jgi:hypothetical protein